MNATDRDALRRYLLGASDALAREELERRLFSDDEIFWERLSIAEDELIDDYATGALDADDRALFDSHFLSTGERRARLEFARAIHAYARRREPGRHRRMALAALVVSRAALGDGRGGPAGPDAPAGGRVAHGAG